MIVLRFSSDQKTHSPKPLIPLRPSCLDSGALIKVDAPGCGTSVVRGQVGSFYPWVQLYPKGTVVPKGFQHKIKPV